VGRRGCRHRVYWAAIYADEQLAVVQGTLDDVRGRIKPKTDANYHWTHEQFRVFVEYLEGRKATAVEGRNRALAALKEAIGLCPEACVEVVDKKLPMPATVVRKEDAVRAALARGAAIVMASTAAEVANIEIDAARDPRLQRALRSRRRHPRGRCRRVVAAASIIRRGRPRMPTLLAGSRSDRVEQAKAYAARSPPSPRRRQSHRSGGRERLLQWRGASVQSAHTARHATWRRQRRRARNRRRRTR
jgi:hypothetical protein